MCRLALGPKWKWVSSRDTTRMPNGGSWTCLSNLYADSVTAADVDADGSQELVCDFGTIAGLWLYDGGVWSQLSGANAEMIVKANVDGNADEMVVDFGLLGCWLYVGGNWTQLRVEDPDHLIVGDLDGDVYDEILVAYAKAGLHQGDLAGSTWTWTQISPYDPD